MAAFVNGTAVRYLDYNDTSFGKCNGHPSDMIPGLMALAEVSEADGASLITAVVVAYEVFCGLNAATKLLAASLDHALSTAVGTPSAPASC